MVKLLFGLEFSFFPFSFFFSFLTRCIWCFLGHSLILVALENKMGGGQLGTAPAQKQMAKTATTLNLNYFTNGPRTTDFPTTSLGILLSVLALSSLTRSFTRYYRKDNPYNPLVSLNIRRTIVAGRDVTLGLRFLGYLPRH